MIPIVIYLIAVLTASLAIAAPTGSEVPHHGAVSAEKRQTISWEGYNTWLVGDPITSSCMSELFAYAMILYGTNGNTTVHADTKGIVAKESMKDCTVTILMFSLAQSVTGWPIQAWLLASMLGEYMTAVSNNYARDENVWPPYLSACDGMGGSTRYVAEIQPTVSVVVCM